MLARNKWFLDPLINQYKKKNKKQKKNVKVGPPLKKRSGSAHGLGILLARRWSLCLLLACNKIASRPESN